MAVMLPFPFDRTWPIDSAIPLACTLEATAPKAGNVHPGRSFHDMHFLHFVASGQAITPILSTCTSEAKVGETVRKAAQATRQNVGCNTNLGTLLLLAPLCISFHRRQTSEPVPSLAAWQAETLMVLQEMDESDSQGVYEAIRIASPGGLGQQDKNDVASAAPQDLLQAMQQVADVDAVARQYCNGFEDIFQRLVLWLQKEISQSSSAEEAICRLQVRQLAHEPDGLIQRKLGAETARQVQKRARELWKAFPSKSGSTASPNQPTALATSREYLEFDNFLREDGNRRNPGTTADLIAASLFVQLASS